MTGEENGSCQKELMPHTLQMTDRFVTVPTRTDLFF